MSEPKKKRGPGRPPQKQLIDPPVRVGIVSQPHISDNVLELSHDDPNVFKSMFTFFKNIKVSDIIINCTSEDMTFFTQDSNRRLLICCKLRGKDLLSYYCSIPHSFSISNIEQLGNIFSTIDKTTNKITISKSTYKPNVLNVTFEDLEIEKACIYDININLTAKNDTNIVDILVPLLDESRTYAIEFTLSAKHFKKTINDPMTVTKYLTLRAQKIENDIFLSFKYNVNSLQYEEIYNKVEKIKLGYFTEDPICDVTFDLEAVKALASSMVSDEIKIMCSPGEKILFRTAEDSVLVVNTFIDEYRNHN